MGDGFWRSPVGHEIAWRQRGMWTRYLRVEGEPEQKASRGSRHRAALRLNATWWINCLSSINTR